MIKNMILGKKNDQKNHLSSLANKGLNKKIEKGTAKVFREKGFY